VITKLTGQWNIGCMNFQTQFTSEDTKITYTHWWTDQSYVNQEYPLDPYDYPVPIPKPKSKRLVKFKVKACVMVRCPGYFALETSCRSDEIIVSESECADSHDEEFLLHPLTTNLVPGEVFRFYVNTCKTWVYELAAVNQGLTSWFGESFHVTWSISGGKYEFRCLAFSKTTGRIRTQNITYDILIPVHKISHDAKSMTVNPGDMITCFGSGYPKPSVKWQLISESEREIFNVSGNVFTVKKAIVPGFYSIKCIGQNKLRGIHFQLHQVYRFNHVAERSVTTRFSSVIILAISTFFIFTVMIIASRQ